jgi:hypothetical protein
MRPLGKARACASRSSTWYTVSLYVTKIAAGSSAQLIRIFRPWVQDALRLVIYAVFFYTIFTLYGSIPLNHIHSLYSAVRSFSARIRDLLKYRMATKNMDAKYPDATEEDIRGMGGESCVICREEMVPGSGRVPDRREGPNDTPKKLGCGHVFHFHCLRSWLERQQSCPTWYVPRRILEVVDMVD